MKTALIAIGAGVGLFLLYRVVSAKAHGVSPGWALSHPTTSIAAGLAAAYSPSGRAATAAVTTGPSSF